MELQADKGWSCYYSKVYGTIPDMGFPICVSNLFIIYSDAANECGVATQLDKTRGDNGCQYSTGGGDPYGGNPNMGTLSGGEKNIPVGNMTWIEINHAQVAGGEESVGAWMFHVTGSGVFFNTGNTKCYAGHGYPDSGSGDPAAFTTCRSMGIDSVQAQ